MSAYSRCLHSLQKHDVNNSRNSHNWQLAPWKQAECMVTPRLPDVRCKKTRIRLDHLYKSYLVIIGNANSTASSSRRPATSGCDLHEAGAASAIMSGIARGAGDWHHHTLYQLLQPCPPKHWKAQLQIFATCHCNYGAISITF